MRHFEAIVFSVKAALAAVVAALVYDWFNLPGAVWAAISAVIVMQPDLHSSFKASLTRVIANLGGAFGGAALLITFGHPLIALALGILITALACHLLKADDAMRPAFAAVTIVMFTTNNGKWDGPRDRAIAVLIGCAVALLVSFLLDKLADWIRPPTPPSDTIPKSSE